MSARLAEQAPQTGPILAVDLDGTLVHTDLLYESFWSACAAHWTTPIDALRQVPAGRAQLKQRMAALAALDVTLLPYNQEAIAYVRNWRDRGGYTVLVTASTQTLAERVADHLGIFDEVHGSDGESNLKAERKADFLVERFGRNGFAYMGDAAADLPVWERSSGAITVNATTRVKNRLAAIGCDTEHLVGTPASALAYLRAMRPHQWLKNSLVFLPALAAHQFTLETLGRSLVAFVVFCLIASSVYMVNDLLDLAPDRSHPRKCRRPLASGALLITHGTWLAPLLLVAGLALAIPLGFEFVLLMLGYYAATTAYSLVLKRRMLVDIFTLAGLYTMRIVAGAVATGIPLSVWLLAFSIFFFFSLAAIKRQAELVDNVSELETPSRRGRGYMATDLSLIAMMATAAGFVSVLVMALYVSSAAVKELYSRPAALWGICLVLFYWISRMEMVTHRGSMNDDPIVFAVKDRISLICLAAIIVFAVGGAVL
jgi:4-hydroxybenzoate polyprenyltransferase/phosphoserine phosphatase